VIERVVLYYFLLRGKLHVFTLDIEGRLNALSLLPQLPTNNVNKLAPDEKAFTLAKNQSSQ